MLKPAHALSGLLLAAGLAGCAAPQAIDDSARALVGAWEVTASRPRGVGKNLLTFSSDGTFFRSGDTHPLLSGGHGSWKRSGAGEFDATYVAFRFDASGQWVGSNKTRLRITPGPGPNEFKGVARTTVRDLQDQELRTSDVRLEGKRIAVEPL